ncbi:MAG TPA: AbrB/MazE/SpoVT family DNA-binding domain-containing protein [Pirellulales bacterium]|jgi:AbrB family looped-hinge helix DNA binding protein
MILGLGTASWKLWVIKMDGRGRITLPLDVREHLDVRPGDTLVMREVEGGLRIEPNKNWVRSGEGEASRTGHTATKPPTED